MKNYFIKSIKTYMDKNNVQLRTDYQKGIYSQEIKKYWDKHKDEFKAETVWTSDSIIASSVYKKKNDRGIKQILAELAFGRSPPKRNRYKKSFKHLFGTGDHEIIMGTLKKDWSIDASDISESSIRVAKGKARAKGIKNINFFVEDANSLTIDDDRSTYDLILSAGALHHIKELENLFLVLQKNLTLSGYFVINEFCGPSQFQWSEKQLKIMNELLEILPDRYKVDVTSGRLKERIYKSSIEYMNENDPSEAIRSNKIVPLATQYFNIEERVDYGGTILHILLQNIVGNFNPSKEEDVAILRLLCYIEEILIKEKVLQSDFAIIVARNNK